MKNYFSIFTNLFCWSIFFFQNISDRLEKLIGYGTLKV